MNNPLLLPSSRLFEGSNLFDEIHQSFIDLENDPPANEVTNLITQSLKYLDNELDNQTLNEIIFLIKSCFEHHPNQPLEIFQEIFENSTKNSNRIIITAFIFSLPKTKTQNLNNANNQKYKNFFTNKLFNQIYKQIQSNNQNFKIFDHEIKEPFKTSFIIDILSIIKMTQQCLDVISPFIFSSEFISNPKITKIINNILKNNLIEYIPESIFVDDNFFSIFSMKNLGEAILRMSKNNIKKLISQIESRFSKEKKFDMRLAVNILIFCAKNDIDFKLIDTLLNSINLTKFKAGFWKYFEKFGTILPLNLARNIIEFPIPVAALKIMPDISVIPIEIVGQALLEFDDLRDYQRVFSSYPNLKNITIFSETQFWLHILKVISKSESKVTNEMLDKLYQIFINFFKVDKFCEVFKSMIFTEFSNDKGNKFLLDFYYKFNYNYKREFIKVMVTFPSIIESKNALPHPSFWKLISLDKLISYNKITTIENPIILYAYEFSYNKYSLNIKQLSIKPILDNELNSNFVLEFIKRKDIDYLMNVNIESLSFIISALIFTSNTQKPEIIGLTKEMIFPFFAIAFIYAEKCKGKLLFESPNISSMLIDACNFLSENSSQLMETSISTILSKDGLFLNKKIFPFESSIGILDNLMSLLINKTYHGDKDILLSSFFSSNEKNLFDKYRIDLFNYIIENIENISNFGLKSSIFQSEIISKIIVDILENSTSFEKVSNVILFLEKYNKEFPNLFITKFENIIQTFNKLLENKKWENAISIYQFIRGKNIANKMIFNNISDFKSLYSKFASYILNNNQPEILSSHFDLFINFMMNDSIVLSDYFIVIFERITKKYSVDPNLILSNYLKEFIFYDDLFIKAIQRVFVYNPLKNSFIRRAFYESTLKQTNLTDLLVLSLLKIGSSYEENFQSFVFLTKIASVFPFIFSQNPIQVFESVLPSLSNFSLLITTQNDCTNNKVIKNVKKAISSFYFIFTTLISVKVLDAFFPWLYENIQTFNESQILAFLIILTSLLENKAVKTVTLGLSIKYKFVEIAVNFLEKEVQKEISLFFKTTIFNFIKSHYNQLNKLNGSKKMVLVDTIQYFENPYSNKFNNFSTLFPKELNLPSFSKLKFPSCNNSIISDFIKNMDEIKKFTLKKPENQPTKLQFDDFISHFNQIEDVSEFEKSSNFSVKVPYISKVVPMSIISVYPNWVYKWIVRNRTFAPLPEHILILEEVTKKINEAYNLQSNSKENKYCNDMKTNEYFTSEFCQNKLYNEIISNSVSCDDEQFFKPLISLVDVISSDDLSLLCFLDILNLYFIRMRDEFNASNDVNNIVNLLLSSKISTRQAFKENFIEVCGNTLIELAISPYYRSNSFLLYNVSKFFIQFTNKIPIRIVHLIGFILVQNQPQIVLNAIDLISKIDESNLVYLRKTIENSFDKNFNVENPSYDIINSYIEKIPSLIKSKIQNIPELLDSVILNYQKSKKNGSLDLICTLFSILAQEKGHDEENEDDGIDFSASYSPSSMNFLKQLNSSSTVVKQLLINQIPQSIKETNPIFWNLLENNRDLINEILMNDKITLRKMKFLLQYPELLNFKTRLNYFREQMKNKIDEYRSIHLNVNRSNVLLCSFNQLRKLKPNEWLRKLSVKFENEAGVDAGGLTNEWFTLVIKELFDLNNALFKLSEKNTYQPNSSSYINKDHIEYFKFAGQVIARAMIDGKCVNCHLMRSFYRQILKCQVKLKDLEEYDEEIYNSLDMILKIDVEPLEFYFAIDVNEYGANKTICLKENGDNILVTNENKKEYVSLYANYHLRKSIIQQVNAFCEGFNSLISHDEICFFSPTELDLLMCGIPEIDIDDLKENISIHYPYSKDHPVIKLFFSVISKWDNVILAKFILFLTGSSQVPISGFKDYKDKGKPISVAPGGDKSRFCVAHTCFNRLDLPEYESEDEMNKKLIESIEQCEFGII